MITSADTTPSFTPHNPALSAPKEKTYFIWVLLASILVWGLLAISLVGLFYAAIFAVMLWFGNGLLTAHLRAEAVKVSAAQLPELHQAFVDVCARLGLAKVPALYVVQSGGMLNAFATRFSGRDFVIVYSDLLEALGPDSAEMKFILGHEVGHIQSRHILKQIFLAPGLFMPLVGPAYRRSWESSCDRYGAFAAQDPEASIRAMLVLSGGPGYARRLSAEAFSAQHVEERGFFVSLHELTSTYPTLSRRVTDLRALRDGAPAASPRRHPLAYLLALGMPGGNIGRGAPGAGILVVFVVMGMMAAMAIPAFAKVRSVSQSKVCENNRRMLSAALDQYRLENGAGAGNWADLIGADKLLKSMPACPLHGEYSADYDANHGYVVSCDADHAPAPSRDGGAR